MIRCIGASSDGRTNRWSITLSCGHSFEPRTTMFGHQFVECPKCKKSAFVDYNKNTVQEDD